MIEKYDPGYVASLFDRMAATYGFLNYVTSFGFSESWRKKCVQSCPPWPASALVLDLMSGMGEAWPSILLHPLQELQAIDLSGGMCERARKNIHRYDRASIVVKQTDALGPEVVDESADAIICCFGLKTLSNEQLQSLAKKVRRTLKPGGVFSFVEISDPRGWSLRWLYLTYLKRIIPFLGRLFGGDPLAYGMLGDYTYSFGGCRQFADLLSSEGLSVEYHRYFFGCATGVSGSREI